MMTIMVVIRELLFFVFVYFILLRLVRVRFFRGIIGGFRVVGFILWCLGFIKGMECFFKIFLKFEFGF